MGLTQRDEQLDPQAAPVYEVWRMRLGFQVRTGLDMGTI